MRQVIYKFPFGKINEDIQLPCLVCIPTRALNIIGSHKETWTHWCVGNKLHLKELMTCCSCSSILLLSNWVPPCCMREHVILHFWASGFSSTNGDNDIYIRAIVENNAWYVIGAQLMGGVVIIATSTIIIDRTMSSLFNIQKSAGKH